MTALYDDAGRYARLYGGPQQKALLRYLNCIKGTVLSPRTQHLQAEIIRGLTEPVARVLTVARRRPIAWVRAYMKLE